jgi:hypothetical protein
MLVTTLKAIFSRDLHRLRNEVTLYNDESALWVVEKRISNSGGNLCLHLIGNLNTYIGKEIGQFDYVRNRDAEFSLRNVPRAELLSKIDTTISIVDASLSNLTPDQLTREYPVKVLEEKTSTEYFLVHLAAHLSYHLGQINYHRRLLDGPIDKQQSDLPQKE